MLVQDLVAVLTPHTLSDEDVTAGAEKAWELAERLMNQYENRTIDSIVLSSMNGTLVEFGVLRMLETLGRARFNPHTMNYKKPVTYAYDVEVEYQERWIRFEVKSISSKCPIEDGMFYFNNTAVTGDARGLDLKTFIKHGATYTNFLLLCDFVSDKEFEVIPAYLIDSKNFVQYIRRSDDREKLTYCVNLNDMINDGFAIKL